MCQTRALGWVKHFCLHLTFKSKCSLSSPVWFISSNFLHISPCSGFTLSHPGWERNGFIFAKMIPVFTANNHPDSGLIGKAHNKSSCSLERTASQKGTYDSNQVRLLGTSIPGVLAPFVCTLPNLQVLSIPFHFSVASLHFFSIMGCPLSRAFPLFCHILTPLWV